MCGCWLHRLQPDPGAACCAQTTLAIQQRGWRWRQCGRDACGNGEIPIHNNDCEQPLRRMVKGRMNWLFHGSEEHACSTANLSSLVARAEQHGLAPEFSLQEILTMIGEYPARQVLELAPNRWVETRSRLIEAGQLRYI
ncbi:MAG TPA: transposase, partial [Polyangiaceae bacterium]|nr:transposase [Polyangiaceae bacterium]